MHTASRPDVGRTRHLVVIAGDRQAAFLALGLALGRQELRIDEHAQLVLGLRDVDDEHAFVNVHLRRGEPHAWRRVHGFGQIADQLADVGRHRRHRGCNFFETRIGVFEDRKQGHRVIGLPNASCRMQNRP